MYFAPDNQILVLHSISTNYLWSDFTQIWLNLKNNLKKKIHFRCLFLHKIICYWTYSVFCELSWILHFLGGCKRDVNKFLEFSGFAKMDFINKTEVKMLLICKQKELRKNYNSTNYLKSNIPAKVIYSIVAVVVSSLNG